MGKQGKRIEKKINGNFSLFMQTLKNKFFKVLAVKEEFGLELRF